MEVSARTYQVGAHFKALIEGALKAPLKKFEMFFLFRVPLPDCADEPDRVWARPSVHQPSFCRSYLIETEEVFGGAD